ncbi:MAG: thioredoxin family protein [Planctomycetes bacterium]|nr:thioredoxin family protein [Planctomycetota bacterium]
MVTITYDDKKTSPEKLAAIIAALEYGVKEVPVVKAESNKGFTPFPAPLPDDAPKAFADSFKAARAAGKPIIIDFWATWCAPCVQLKKKTLEDPEVVKQLEGIEVIYVNLDEHPELAKAYGVSSIPDVFFINAQGKVVDRLKAFEEPKPFLERVKKMVGKTEKTATLGIDTAVPSDETASAVGLTNKVRVLGRLVTKVEPESAAAKAGLKVDDVILRLGSNDLYSADDIADFLSVSKPGDQVPLVFKRSGSSEEYEATATLGEVEVAAVPGSRLVWQYSSLGQLPGALEQARAEKKKVLVGLSGAET